MKDISHNNIMDFKNSNKISLLPITEKSISNINKCNEKSFIYC